MLLLLLVLILVVIVVLILIVLVLVLILILVLVLIVLVLIVLVLILVLILILVLVLLVLVLLVLQLLLCVDVVLLGINITRIPQQRLLECVYGSLPVLTGNCKVTEIIIVVSRICACRSYILHRLHYLLSLLGIVLTIQGIGQIVCRSDRKGILHEGLSVIDFSLTPVLLPEISVTLAHVLLIYLSIHLDNAHKEQKQYI